MANLVKEEEKNEKTIRGLMKLPANPRCINCNSLGGGLNKEAIHQMNQDSIARSKPDGKLCHMNASTSAPLNNVGTSLTSQTFREQQLKQLRAQCLVFRAFRNNLMPRKLHL